MNLNDAKNHCFALAEHLRGMDSESGDAIAIETILMELNPIKTLHENMVDCFHNAMTDSLQCPEGTTAFYTAGKFRQGISAGINALDRAGYLQTMSIQNGWTLGSWDTTKWKLVPKEDER